MMIISPTRRWIGRTARLFLVLTIGMIAYAWRYAHAADRQFYRFTRNVVSPDGTSRNVLRQHIDVLDLMRSTHGDLIETTTHVIVLRGTLYLNIETKTAQFADGGDNLRYKLRALYGFTPLFPDWDTGDWVEVPQANFADLLSTPTRFGFAYEATTRQRLLKRETRRLILPLWTIFAPALATCVCLLLWPYRKRLRRTSGHCPNCNYDLRASQDRCPECGHPIPNPNRGAGPR
jgi:hypothetical protein